MAVFGLNNALIPIVAFNIGAKHAERIKKVIRLSGAYSALIGLVGLIIMEMLPIQLISAFAPSEEMFLLAVEVVEKSRRSLLMPKHITLDMDCVFWDLVLCLEEFLL